MSSKWLVVGGGFRGIVGAYLLASNGQKVTLIERSPYLGGVLYSRQWKDFYLDNGCHLFSNSADATTSILLDLLQGEIKAVQVRYASILNSQKTDGMAIPDLTSYGEQSSHKILIELLEATSQGRADRKSLKDALDSNFGKTAADFLGDAAYKMYQINIAELDAKALPLTPFRRIKFTDDSIATLLKESPTLDAKIAASSQSDPMRYYRNQAREYPNRNFYPAGKGLRRFCELAHARLEDLGVNIIFGQQIHRLSLHRSSVEISLGSDSVFGERLLWAAGIEALAKTGGIPQERISSHIHNVPMAVYYFVIPKAIEGSYTYVHNFQNSDLCFRVSIPGKYGETNCPPELSYICCEVPTTLESPVWSHPENFTQTVWDELHQYNLLEKGSYLDVFVTKTPSSYKLPKLNYDTFVAEVTNATKLDDRVLGANHWDFSKEQIIDTLQKSL